MTKNKSVPCILQAFTKDKYLVLGRVEKNFDTPKTVQTVDTATFIAGGIS